MYTFNIIGLIGDMWFILFDKLGRVGFGCSIEWMSLCWRTECIIKPNAFDPMSKELDAAIMTSRHRRLLVLILASFPFTSSSVSFTTAPYDIFVNFGPLLKVCLKCKRILSTKVIERSIYMCLNRLITAWFRTLTKQGYILLPC